MQDLRDIPYELLIVDSYRRKLQTQLFFSLIFCCTKLLYLHMHFLHFFHRVYPLIEHTKLQLIEINISDSYNKNIWIHIFEPFSYLYVKKKYPSLFAKYIFRMITKKRCMLFYIHPYYFHLNKYSINTSYIYIYISSAMNSWRVRAFMKRKPMVGSVWPNCRRVFYRR